MLPRIARQMNVSFKIAMTSVLVVVVFLFALSLLFAPPALAQNDVDADTFGVSALGDSETGLVLGREDIRVVIAKIIQVVFGLIGIIMLVIVVYAGWLMMTSGGSEEKMLKGRKYIINATIGLAIMLSAITITQFLINALANATGADVGGGQGSARGPDFENFVGSGALGRIVRDHYPERNQTDVARNTKISVTFNEPIDPASIIENTNNTCWAQDGTGPVSMDNPDNCARDGEGELIEYFGDCVARGENEPFDWAVLCDHLKQSSVIISPLDDQQAFVQGAALASYEGDEQDAFTFVFRPFEPIGDSIEPVSYRVRLTANVLKKDGETTAFINNRNSFYEWSFETGTTLDVSAPSVVSVYPTGQEQQPVAKNSLIQITFNEAIDPTSVVGKVSPDSFFTNLLVVNREQGNGRVTDTTISGRWQVSNGNKTVEFVPEGVCGQNSCGETIHCLPLTCEDEGEQCVNTMMVLSRTADLFGDEANPFSAIPLTGIVDMADNALDGDADEIADGKPSLANLHQITVANNDGEVNEIVADNFFWEFDYRNVRDIRAPYIRQVEPGLDQEDVDRVAPIEITFDQPMWQFSLNTIAVVEHPENPNIDELWHMVRTRQEGNRTIARVLHREFGVNDVDAYYFPTVPTSVKSLTQNCVYPGRGPTAPEGIKNTSPICQYDVDNNNVPLDDPENGANCTPVSFDSQTDTGCVQTTSQAEFGVTAPSIEECVTRLKRNDVSRIE